jgi:hypothetical protein
MIPHKSHQKTTMKAKDTGVPANFLTRLNEFTGGGFILIYANGDGQVVIEDCSDNVIIQSGLERHALEYFKAREEDFSESIKDGVAMSNFIAEGGDEEAGAEED